MSEPGPLSQGEVVATPASHDMAKVASQAPGSSIYTLLIEAAAMVSVILIVVFSVSMRYRRREKD
jgi:hypothetical protein